MAAPDDDDFTFCQLGQQVDDGDSLDSPKGVPDVNRITLQDDHNASNGDPSETRTTTILSEEPALQKPVLETKNSTSQTQEQMSVVKKKPVARAKVPFEKGYSQMDWLKLTRTESDLAGLKGRSNRRLISLDEVKQHKGDGSVWTVLKGHVYNISPYMKFHPGGVDMLMKAAGKDCTSLFNKYHAWVNAEFMLEKCLVGVLDSS